MKYVVITGGVVSGLGKGITASSVGALLKECGLSVTAIKIDPYLNIDAGTMSPYEHGEVYVLDDGGEVDLDLGNYERFLNITLTRDHNITTGKIYKFVLDRERTGAYLGKTVQMIPHITDAVKDWLSRVAQIPVDGSSASPDVCVVELGGTVGDIESMVFLEALRQLKFQVGAQNFCHIHVSLITVVGAVGEQKSKPTQHSVTNLRAAGLIPNMIVCRCTKPISRSVRQKVSLFSMVPPSHVLSVHDVANIYQVPRLLLEQNVTSLVMNSLNINRMAPIELPVFDILAQKMENSARTVTIGVVGKYTGLSDSYISLIKAVRAAALHCDLKLEVVWIESTDLEPPKTIDSAHDYGSPSRIYQKHVQSLHDSPMASPLRLNDSKADTNATPVTTVKLSTIGDSELIGTNDMDTPDNDNDDDAEELIPMGSDISDSKDDDSDRRRRKSSTPLLSKHERAWSNLEAVDGILIPGGFGDRGVEGKIRAVNYARVNRKPFLGICLGMQVSVIEYARHVCNMKHANSSEFDPDTKSPVVIFMPEVSQTEMGGTMRLGGRLCRIKKSSIAQKLYGKEEIKERHRHRYEVNPQFTAELEKCGLIFSGKDELGERMEIIELPLNKHPFFFGCQFHPEFKSGPNRPSPPFLGLIKASAGLYRHQQQQQQSSQIQQLLSQSQSQTQSQSSSEVVNSNRSVKKVVISEKENVSYNPTDAVRNDANNQSDAKNSAIASVLTSTSQSTVV